MKKKLFALCLSMALTVTLVLPVMAASGADAVNNKLEEIRAEYSGNADAIVAVDKAKEWVAQKSAAITDEVARELIKEIDKAKALADSFGAGDYSRADLLANTELYNKLLDIMNRANELVKLNFLASTKKSKSSGDQVTLTVNDADGNILLQYPSENPIKQTGLTPDFSGLLAVSLAVTGLFAAAVTLAATGKKRNLSNA